MYEAEAEYEAFEESYQEAKDDKVAALNEEDKGLLKKLYRKAAKLCHPDTAADAMKDQATEMMKLLNQARDQGDLKAIQLLLEKLEKGTAFVLASDMLTDRAQVEEKIAELLAKLEGISAEIEAIQESETWQLIETIDSWETYFKAQQEDLAEYLKQVRQEYERLVNRDLSEGSQSETHPSPSVSRSFNKQTQSETESSASKSNTVAENYWEVDF